MVYVIEGEGPQQFVLSRALGNHGQELHEVTKRNATRFLSTKVRL